MNVPGLAPPLERPAPVGRRPRGLFLLLAVVAGSTGSPVRGDEVELVSGKRYQGRLTRETGTSLSFQVNLGGGQAELTWPLSEVHTLKIGNEERTITEKAVGATQTPGAPIAEGGVPDAPDKPDRVAKAKKPVALPPGDTRTPAEVQALIQKAGTTQPGWWAQASLSYPPTLKLDFSGGKGKGWNPQTSIAQYLWSVVNENPSRWEEGTRLLHHCLTVNQGNSLALRETIDHLGGCYHNLLCDWARAAFWWQKECSEEELLADCYWQLGSKTMAAAVLTRMGEDNTAHARVVKLWGAMGELPRALALAEGKAKRGSGDIAYLAAGDACRIAGRYAEALAYYEKSASYRQNKNHQARIDATIDAIKVFDALDLSKVKDGTWKSSSFGYSGTVSVEVQVAGGKVLAVRVGNHSEKQFYSSITETPARIVAKQGVKGVDTTSSATITSEAIINAAAKALAAGMR